MKVLVILGDDIQRAPRSRKPQGFVSGLTPTTVGPQRMILFHVSFVQAAIAVLVDDASGYFSGSFLSQETAHCRILAQHHQVTC